MSYWNFMMNRTSNGPFTVPMFKSPLETLLLSPANVAEILKIVSTALVLVTPLSALPRLEGVI